MTTQTGLLLLLSLGLITLTTFSLSAQEEPLTAVVINDYSCLWSGPGNHYYPTTRLHTGERLEVYFMVKEDWCAVRPTKGCFTWVDARNVELGEKQIGTVLLNGVQSRVGSDLNNQCGAVQVTLKRGEKVFVLERVETPGDTETPVWYKIAPPAGEFRFIPCNDLQWDHVVPNKTFSNTQNNTPQNSEADTTHRPQPLRERQPIQLVNDLQPRISQEKLSEELNAGDFHVALEQLKLDFAEYFLEQEVTADSLQSLSHIARMLYQSAPTQADKDEIYRLLAGLERVTRVRRYESQNQNLAENQTDNIEPQAENDHDRRLISSVSSSHRDVVTIDTKTNKQNDNQARAVPNIGDAVASSNIYEQTMRYPIRNAMTGNDVESSVLPTTAETTQVLLYDKNTGTYQEIPPEDWSHYLTAEQTPMYQQQYPYQSYRQFEPPKRSWLQRLISGDLLRNGNANTSNNKVTSGSVTMNNNSFFADTYPIENHGYGSVYNSTVSNANNIANSSANKTSLHKGFYNSQPMIISSPQKNNLAANSYQRSRLIKNPYNNVNIGNETTPIAKNGQHIRSNIPQEIIIPEGVEVPDEVVVYDEYQGINLTPQTIFGLQTSKNGMPNTTPSETETYPITDQAAALTQIIQSRGITVQEPPSVVSETPTVSQSRQPTILKQTASRQPAKQTVAHSENHLVNGQRENGVNVVSANAFDAIGRLGRIKVNQDKPNDVPKYALVNDAGKTNFLISQTVGIDLNQYVNQTVGLIGIQSSYVQDGKTYPHISVKAVYPIQGQR
ncbi:MAG: hypothetical protein LBJ67_03140 [Planctomycetaceae bacterium]|nr:hypothetical protein [Planctomycetaceae bacterium]